MSTETRQENKKYRDDCQLTVTRSRLPSGISKTLQCLLSYIGSASNYSLAWIGVGTIAEKVGYTRRAVEKHLSILTEAGVITRKTLTRKEAVQFFTEQFARKLTLLTNNEIAFTSLNRSCPLWCGQSETTIELIEKLSVRAKMGRKKHAEKGQSRAVTPVSGDVSLPSPETCHSRLQRAASLPSPETDELLTEERADTATSLRDGAAEESASPEQSDTNVSEGGSLRVPPSAESKGQTVPPLAEVETSDETRTGTIQKTQQPRAVEEVADATSSAARKHQSVPDGIKPLSGKPLSAPEPNPYAVRGLSSAFLATSLEFSRSAEAEDTVLEGEPAEALSDEEETAPVCSSLDELLSYLD